MKNTEFIQGTSAQSGVGRFARPLARVLSLGGVLLSSTLTLSACSGDARESASSLTQELSQFRIEAEAYNRFSWSTRRTVITTAINNLNTVRAQFGTNFNYQLGSGTLMY